MKKTNILLKNLVNEIRAVSSKENSKFWKRIADELEKPTRKRCIVNVSSLDRHTNENEMVIVPGKVLASGEINHKLTVAAYQFSQQAKEKINKIGSSMSISDLLKKNPKGQNTRILG